MHNWKFQIVLLPAIGVGQIEKETNTRDSSTLPQIATGLGDITPFKIIGFEFTSFRSATSEEVPLSDQSHNSVLGMRHWQRQTTMTGRKLYTSDRKPILRHDLHTVVSCTRWDFSFSQEFLPIHHCFCFWRQQDPESLFIDVSHFRDDFGSYDSVNIHVRLSKGRRKANCPRKWLWQLWYGFQPINVFLWYLNVWVKAYSTFWSFPWTLLPVSWKLQMTQPHFLLRWARKIFVNNNHLLNIKLICMYDI